MQHADHVALLRPGVSTPGAAGGTWADVGSGGGAFTLALAELLGPGATLYSIDRDTGALRAQGRELSARYPGVNVVPVAADFTRPLPAAVPLLDGLVMANALHYVPDRHKLDIVRQLKARLKPGGRWVLVEYNVDSGNLWVPHPLSYPAWQALAQAAGFTQTRLLGTRPSRFLREFYAAESV
jgi:SAM-dependent methyltransferase